MEAISSGKTVDKIFLQRNLRNERINEIIQAAKENEIPVQLVPEEKLQRLTTKIHQGVVAFLTGVNFFKLDDVLAQTYERGETPLILIADKITDVRNFGAIARTAYACGVHAIVIPFSGAAALNEDAVKSSSGALNKINLCREKDLVRVVKELRLNGIQTLAADGKAGKFVHEADLKIPTAIIMGSEGEGIENNLLRLVDEIVKLPMANNFDSFNVSVATGMILYEAMKQRLF